MRVVTCWLRSLRESAPRPGFTNILTRYSIWTRQGISRQPRAKGCRWQRCGNGFMPIEETTMNYLTADEAMCDHLRGVLEPVEIRDEKGKLLGQYTPFVSAEERALYEK